MKQLISTTVKRSLLKKTRESEEVFDEAAYFNDGEEIFVEKNSDKDSKFVVRFD